MLFQIIAVVIKVFVLVLFLCFSVVFDSLVTFNVLYLYT